MRSERDVRQKAKNIEWVTVLLILGFVGFGLITIGNVMAEPFTGQESGISDMLKKLSLEYVQRQASNFLIGLAALIIVAAIDYSLLRNIVNYVYIANIVLLVMLLIVRNNTRGVFGWFTIGARAFQPSELCKVTLIIMLSKLAADAVERDGALKSFKDIAIMMFYFGLPFALVIMQPDFGTAVVFIAILICILFVSKISWKYIVSAVAVGAALLPLSYYNIFTDEQKRRIDVFLDPTEDLLGSGMHVARSKEAIGSGQLIGKGYFREGTLAQLKYVPERHTDFVFSGIVEGLGFVGGTILIVAYFFLIFRWLWIALHAKDHFGTCLVIGATSMLLAHVFENIGMSIGLMPVTGIPLPFISYGGSNLLANMLSAGLVLNVWFRRPQRR